MMSKISKLQKSVLPCIRRGPLKDYVRKLVKDYRGNVTMKSQGYELIQEALESYIHKIFDHANDIVAYSGKKTLNPKVIELSRLRYSQCPRA